VAHHQGSGRGMPAGRFGSDGRLRLPHRLHPAAPATTWNGWSGPSRASKKAEFLSTLVRKGGQASSDQPHPIMQAMQRQPTARRQPAAGRTSCASKRIQRLIIAIAGIPGKQQPRASRRPDRGGGTHRDRLDNWEITGPSSAQPEGPPSGHGQQLASQPHVAKVAKGGGHHDADVPARLSSSLEM